MNLSRWVKLGAFVALLLVGGSLAYGWAMGNRAGRLDDELARQRSKYVEQKRRADGWSVLWADIAPDLLAEAAERDSTIARLRETARLAGSHPVAMVQLEATAALDTVFVADTVYAGGWLKHYAVSAFSGVVQCRPPQDIALSVRARIRPQLVTEIAPDGRVLISARPTQQGVSIDLEEFIWSPPETDDASFWSRASWLAVGAAVGVIGGQLVFDEE